MPDDFPEDKTETATEVLSIVAAVQAERGGNVPGLRGVGLAIRRFPQRDHVAVAHDLEHWTLAGSGQTKPLKDAVRLYATFLERAPDAAPMRTNGHHVANGRVESTTEYLARRGMS